MCIPLHSASCSSRRRFLVCHNAVRGLTQVTILPKYTVTRDCSKEHTPRACSMVNCHTALAQWSTTIQRLLNGQLPYSACSMVNCHTALAQWSTTIQRLLNGQLPYSACSMVNCHTALAQWQSTSRSTLFIPTAITSLQMKVGCLHKINTYSAMTAIVARDFVTS